MKRDLLGFLGFIPLLVACETTGPPTPNPTTLTAQSVRIDVLLEGGTNAVLEGDVLEYDMQSKEMRMGGNARIGLGDPLVLEAEAARISFRDGFDVLELSGAVRAVLTSEAEPNRGHQEYMAGPHEELLSP